MSILPTSWAPLETVSLIEASTAADDLGNAERLAAFTADRLLHAEGLGFLFYTGSHWENLDAQALVTIGAHMARQFSAEVEDAIEAGADRSLRSVARQATHTQSIRSAVDHLKGMVSAPVSSFDAHPHLLAAANGTIDLRTGTLRSHRRSDRLTRSLAVDFDPEATAPAFEAFLESVQPDPAVRAYLRRLLGYGITGETSEQILSVWIGGGANGKSVLQDISTTLLRDYTSTPRFSTFTAKGERFGLATLRGSRLVFAPEGNSSAVLDEALLKRATGQDDLEAEQKYKDPFTYRPEFLLTLISNSFPRIVTDDEGTWRRFHVLRWPVTIAKPDRIDNLAARLVAAEGPGILAWLVAGSVEWHADGLQAPASVTAETKRRRDVSDTLSGFVGPVLVEDSSSNVRLTDAFAAFGRWADALGIPDADRFRTSSAFRAALEERGIDAYKNSVTCLRGVRINEAAVTASVAVDPGGAPGTIFETPGLTPVPGPDQAVTKAVGPPSGPLRALLAESERLANVAPEVSLLEALGSLEVGPAYGTPAWCIEDRLDAHRAAVLWRECGTAEAIIEECRSRFDYFGDRAYALVVEDLTGELLLDIAA